MLDTVIIGSGPAGLGAAIYASRAALDYVVLEKAGYSGGQIVTTNDLDNYPGMPNIDGASFSMALQEHAEKLGAVIKEATVTAIERNDDKSFTLKIDGQDDIITKTVILATGANPRTLNIPGEAQFLSRGVYYCATCDGMFFRDKVTAVIGGGNTALEDVLFLAKICKKVYLIHRRDELRGDKHSQEKIFALPNVEFVPSAVPKSIKGDKKVTTLEIELQKTGETKEIAVDGIFVAVGMIPNNKLVPDFVATDKAGYVIADETGVTNTAGFFVAGDLRTKALRQVITAASDGANAIKSVTDYLNA
ncbi:NAD(P)/FAD-dependent oxidoreductase [Megamonas hypermegale]|uniref:NAD(P)/FAD-dependent oxidoreductase n=1 Tax=Megamonas hypermegale TaxID=158847 RepID=UPI0025A4C8C0|nr:FAD-dependent oxidoreductase [Megamonas hypermegale]MDM8143847.1 FAD-dependent oxidoreductase [Megamonas hypermegale]